VYRLAAALVGNSGRGRGTCRRSFHAPRLGKGCTSQPGWSLGSAALRHRSVAGPCRTARLQGGSCVTSPVAAHPSHRASLSFPSGNAKTGPIAVSSTSRRTCPSSCSLAGDQGCYAEAGFHTRLHWDRLSSGATGISPAALIKQVLALPAGVLFRHCVAGDQWPDPADPLRIDQALLLQLARATRHLRAAWSFTHYPMSPENQAALRQAAAKGLVVNASTESRRAAAALVRQGIPAVCVVPSDAPAVFHHEGVRFVACPACRSGAGPRIQCSSCGGRFGLPLCAQADRPFVISFPAHGARAAAAAAHCS